MNVNPFSYLIEKLKGKVNKSGDTMTGQLQIGQSSETPLIVQRTDSNGNTYIRFSNKDNILGNFGISHDKKPMFYAWGDMGDKELALKSDIADIGSHSTKLGAFNQTGDYTLSDSYNNYRFIYVVCGYYNGFKPTYGTFFAPTAFAVSDGEEINFTTINANARFRLYGGNKIYVGSTGSNNYMTVYGIN